MATFTVASFNGGASTTSSTSSSKTTTNNYNNSNFSESSSVDSSEEQQSNNNNNNSTVSHQFRNKKRKQSRPIRIPIVLDNASPLNLSKQQQFDPINLSSSSQPFSPSSTCSSTCSSTNSQHNNNNNGQHFTSNNNTATTTTTSIFPGGQHNNNNNAIVAGSVRIFNPEAYCELCNKEFCNKYFLKTHKANKHGVYSSSSLEQSATMTPPTTIERGCSSSSESFCQLCNKDFCNKYFLRRHRAKFHGIIVQTDSGREEDDQSNEDCEEVYKQKSSSCSSSTTSNNSIATGLKSDNNKLVSSAAGIFQQTTTTTTKDPEFECSLCVHSFPSLYLLQMHNSYFHSNLATSFLLPPPSLNSTPSSLPSSAVALGHLLNNEEAAAADDLRRLQSMILELSRNNQQQQQQSGVESVICPICCKEFYSSYFLSQHISTSHSTTTTNNNHNNGQNTNFGGILMNVKAEREIVKVEEEDEGMNQDNNMQRVPDKYEYEDEEEDCVDEGVGGEEGKQVGGSVEKNGKQQVVAVQSKVSPVVAISKSVGVDIGGKSVVKAISPSLSRSYCTICHKELCNKYFMRTHMLKMHGINIESSTGLGGVTCDICHKELCSKYFLKVHKQNTHGIVHEDTTTTTTTTQNSITNAGIQSSSSSSFGFEVTADETINNNEDNNKRKQQPMKWSKSSIPSRLNGKPSTRDFDDDSLQCRMLDPLSLFLQKDVKSASNTSSPSSKMLYCRFCPFSTSLLVYLYAHEKSHSSTSLGDSSRQFQCPICLCPFGQLDTLQRHILNQHQQQNPQQQQQVEVEKVRLDEDEEKEEEIKKKKQKLRFVCSKCKMRFSLESECDIHIQHEHPRKKLIPCKRCEFKSTTLKRILIHSAKTHHKNKKIRRLVFGSCESGSFSCVQKFLVVGGGLNLVPSIVYLPVREMQNECIQVSLTPQK